jgi:24-methylenesterol C-methyltransferase
MASFDKLTDSLKDAWGRAAELSSDNKNVVSVAVGGAVVLGAWWLLQPSKDKKKPSTSQLTGGGISREKVKKEFDDYSKAYGAEAGAGIIERSRTTELVDTFYNLVTDIYEWGWGQVYFLFSPANLAFHCCCPSASSSAKVISHAGQQGFHVQSMFKL